EADRSNGAISKRCSGVVASLAHESGSCCVAGASSPPTLQGFGNSLQSPFVIRGQPSPAAFSVCVARRTDPSCNMKRTFSANRHKELRMIDVYFWPTPNGYKITWMLEEVGLKYNLIPVNIGAGDQFKPEFLKISPNNRMPAMTDPDGPGGMPISIFESGAI